GSQLRLAPTFFAISLVLPCHFAMKTAIFLVRRGRDEMGDAHVYPHKRGRDLGLKRNVLIKREREPPDPVALVEHRGRVERFACEGLLVIGGEFDWDLKGVAAI